MVEKSQMIDGEIVEIHPDAKYALLLKGTDSGEMDRILEMLQEWWNSKDIPIIVLSNGVKLVRVDNEQNT